MHPILRERRALLAYGAAWLLASYLPATVLAAPGDPLFLLALAVAAPATVLLGLAALPIHYLCRALPLGSPGGAVALRVHAALGLVTGAAWWGLLRGGAALVDDVAPARLGPEVERRWGALFVVGVVLYLAVAAFFTTAASLGRARASQRRAVAASLRAQEARLALLRAQVHPHFLFNSLNAISALTVQDPRTAREVCVLLADFLRGSLALGEKGE